MATTVWADMGVGRGSLPRLLVHPDAGLALWLWRAWCRARRLSGRALRQRRVAWAVALDARARERRRELYGLLDRMGVR